MSILALHAIALQAAREEQGHTELPMPPVAFGIVAMCIFIALLLITFAFRHAGTRH